MITRRRREQAARGRFPNGDDDRIADADAQIRRRPAGGEDALERFPRLRGGDAGDALVNVDENVAAKRALRALIGDDVGGLRACCRQPAAGKQGCYAPGRKSQNGKVVPSACQTIPEYAGPSIHHNSIQEAITTT